VSLGIHVSGRPAATIESETKPCKDRREAAQAPLGMQEFGSMYGNAFFAAIGFGLFAAATASQAACVKPDAPSCAFERIPFASEATFDDCRMNMIKFRDAMDQYASCLGETSTDREKAARDEYEDVRIRFNQRARGEFDSQR
jgi:hypothetical protein